MSYASQVLATQPGALYGFWKMDEPSGTTMTDSSGNARHGTYVNAPSLGQAGVIPNSTDLAALYVASSNDYASVPDDNGLDGLTAFTVCGWINAVSLPTNAMLAGRDGTVGAGRSFQWRISATDKLEFVRIPGTTVTAASATTLLVGTPYHVGVVYNNTDLRIYINGVLDGTPAACTGTLGTSTEDLRFAARRNNVPVTTDFWDGKEQSMAVWTAALSAAEMLALFAAGVAVAGVGSVTLSGTGAGAGAGSASGSIALSGIGTATGGTDAGGSGSLLLSGAGSAAGVVSGSGSLTLGGTAAGVGQISGTGSLVLGGTGTAVIASTYPPPQIPCCTPAMTRRRAA